MNNAGCYSVLGLAPSIPPQPVCKSHASSGIETEIADLLAYAEELEVENASTLRKQDMMFAILKRSPTMTSPSTEAACLSTVGRLWVPTRTGIKLPPRTG